MLRKEAGDAKVRVPPGKRIREYRDRRNMNKGEGRSQESRFKTQEVRTFLSSGLVKISYIGTVVYIANLSKRVIEKDLEEAFEKYGRITNCTIVKDPITRYVPTPTPLTSMHHEE